MHEATVRILTFTPIQMAKSELAAFKFAKPGVFALFKYKFT